MTWNNAKTKQFGPTGVGRVRILYPASGRHAPATLRHSISNNPISKKQFGRGSVQRNAPEIFRIVGPVEISGTRVKRPVEPGVIQRGKDLNTPWKKI